MLLVASLSQSLKPTVFSYTPKTAVMMSAKLSGRSAPPNSPSVLIPVANGSEEIETVTIADILVRCGAKVTLASVNSHSLQVSCSRGVNLVADAYIGDCAGQSWDMIVCPGGDAGAQRLRDCSTLRAMLEKQNEKKKFIGAICAAPAVVLCHNGLISDRKLTCYPSEKFTAILGSHYCPERTVVDGHVITSQGPGTAMEFALQLVEQLTNTATAERVKNELVANYS